MFINDQIRAPRFMARRRLGQTAPMPSAGELLALVNAKLGPYATQMTDIVPSGPIGSPSTSYELFYFGGTDPAGAQTTRWSVWGSDQMAPLIAQWQAAHGIVIPTTSAPTTSPTIIPVAAPAAAAATPVPVAATTPAPTAAAKPVSQAEFDAFVQSYLAAQQPAAPSMPQYVAVPSAPTVAPVDQERGAAPVVVAAAPAGLASWWWLLALAAAGGVLYYFAQQPEPRRRRAVKAPPVQPVRTRSRR